MELPIETRRLIIEELIANSTVSEFKIASSARAFNDCKMIPQAETQAKNLEGQQAMTAALQKQLDELK